MSTTSSQNALLQRLTTLEILVARVAERALELFRDRHSLVLQHKGPLDFVSAADREVERLLREALAEQFPGEAVMGEELGGELQGSCWVIDPIDGTSNFLRGLPLWGLSVGYMVEGEAVLGVVNMPVLQESVSAAKGLGLRLNGVAVERQQDFSAVKSVCTGIGCGRQPLTTKVSRELEKIGYECLTYRSAAVALAFTALGRVDGYVESGIWVWDFAAGLCLCAEGGVPVEQIPLESHPGRFSFFAGAAVDPLQQLK